MDKKFSNQYSRWFQMSFRLVLKPLKSLASLFDELRGGVLRRSTINLSHVLGTVNWKRHEIRVIPIQKINCARCLRIPQRDLSIHIQNCTSNFPESNMYPKSATLWLYARIFFFWMSYTSSCIERTFGFVFSNLFQSVNTISLIAFWFLCSNRKYVTWKTLTTFLSCSTKKFKGIA